MNYTEPTDNVMHFGSRWNDPNNKKLRINKNILKFDFFYISFVKNAI